jgi:hypothetical protein
MMFDFFFTNDSENAKLAEQVRSSPGLIAFIAPSDNRAGWAAAGRAYQRFALQATVDGLKHAFVNQAVEVPDVRREHFGHCSARGSGAPACSCASALVHQCRGPGGGVCRMCS